MTVESPRIRSLLRQADNNAAVGKRAAAEQLYRQIVDESPETAEAWRGLAQVARSAEEREAATARAKELDPDYEVFEEELSTTVQSRSDDEAQPARPATGAIYSDDGRSDASPYDSTAGRDEDQVVEADVSHTHTFGAGVGSGEADEELEALFCANHPGRETHLRCNRCGKPICSSCANPTPVGYRCPECIREQEDVYYTATPLDYLVTLLVVLPLSLLVGFVAALILSSPFGFFLIFLGAFSGSLIGRVAFRVAGRRRGRWMPHMVVICVVIGGILPSLGFIVAAFLGQFSLRLLFLGIYLVAAAGAAYYQMR
jgi:hypothetical protein